MPTESASALDTELAAFLARLAPLEAEAAALAAGWPPAQRQRWLGELAAAALPRADLPDVTRRDYYAAAAGREIPIRLYLPAGGATRLLAYCHGGGWVLGSIATHDALCAELADATGYAVASIHYRRAPENPYPAGLDDAWEALAWLQRHGRAMGLDPRAPVALGGDSAGAHLMLGCAMRSQDRPGIAIDRQLLFYPPITPQADTASRRTYDRSPGLRAATMAGFWRDYAGPGAPADDPCLFPLRWRGRRPLPATVLMTAELDILRDEGEAYGRHLADTGTAVTLLRAAGMVHGFARMWPASRLARRHVRQACAALVSCL